MRADYAGKFSLAGYKTLPSVVPHLPHAAAAEVVHEKVVLMSPEEED